MLLTTCAVLFLIDAGAAGNVHLLGFVDRLCDDRPRCFIFRVETVYSGEVNGPVTVHYDESSQIFDPENYRVTPLQSNIVVGSHLRVLMEPVTEGYYAGFIWVGD